jgi:membrane protein YdbS with pleckstrin-like domain
MDPVDIYPFDGNTREFVKAGRASPNWRLVVGLQTQLWVQLLLLCCIITIPLMPIAAILIYIWSFAYVRSYHFQFTEDRIIVTRGVISKRTAHIPYEKIQNLVIGQSIIERLAGVYSINVETAGAPVRTSGLAFYSDASIQGLLNPEPLKDFIYWMVKRKTESGDTDGITFTSAKSRRDKTDIAVLRELQSISSTLHSMEALMRAQNPAIDQSKIDSVRAISVQCPTCYHTFNSAMGSKVRCPSCGTEGQVGL